ncbi:MAG TPA: sugar-binding protein, partial [Firmicutes bacterium]|nr:sugar-binding protein [Bacillota bacterium]
MKKTRFLVVLMVLALLVSVLSVSGFSAEKVTLTLGSWRSDDVDAVNKVLTTFEAKYPNINIKFNPTNPPDYNA